MVYYLIKNLERPQYKTSTTTTLHSTLPIHHGYYITLYMLPVQPSLLYCNPSVQTPSKGSLRGPFSSSFWRILSKTHSPKKRLLIIHKTSFKTSAVHTKLMKLIDFNCVTVTFVLDMSSFCSALKHVRYPRPFSVMGFSVKK